MPLPADDPRPRQLIEAWFEDSDRRHGLRGVARLAVDGDGGAIHLRGKQVLVAEQPARLRIEILGFLNQSIAVLATDGERFEVFRSEDRSYESGEVDAALLWNEAGIALRPEEAVAVLLGVPLQGPALVPVAAARRADGVVQIELADSDGALRQRVAFDSAGRLRRSERVAKDGRFAWRARFADYRDVDGSPFAHTIILDVAAGATHAEISLREVELNPALPPDIFRIRLPGAAGGVDGEGG